MSKTEGGTGSGISDEVLAGEYVLGALPADRARRVEARLATDGHFASIVQRWQDNLAETTFNEDDDRWQKLAFAPERSRRAGIASHRASLIWRSLLLTGLCLAGAYTVFEALAPKAAVSLASTNGLASPIYEASTGSVSLPDIREPARIWLIGMDNQAHLLGEIAPGSRLLLSADMQAMMGKGASLATAPATR